MAKTKEVKGKPPFVEKGKGKMPFDMKRKAGGKVEGKKAEARPDRRARGGATSDPLSGAGSMSKLPFESKQAPAVDQGGKGTQKG